MRKLLYILPIFLALLLCAGNVFAQKADSAKNYFSERSAPTPAKPGSGSLVILDGKIYAGSLETIDPKSIADITIMEGEQAKTMYGALAANGAIIIKTKNNSLGNKPGTQLFSPTGMGSGKISAYQAKLSAISADYKAYLADHNNDDTALSYIIDGSILKHDYPAIQRLAALPADSIRNVSLLQTKDHPSLTTSTLLIETIKN